jgi:hypothetical protein
MINYSWRAFSGEGLQNDKFLLQSISAEGLGNDKLFLESIFRRRFAKLSILIAEHFGGRIGK